MPECAKAHLQQSIISKFFLRMTPLGSDKGRSKGEEGLREGKGMEGREGKAKGQGKRE